MAQEKQDDFNFQTSHRVAYADIIAPRAFTKNGQAKGEPKYSGTFIIPADNADLARLKQEATKMLQAKAPGKKLVTRRLTQEELDAGNVIEVQVPWKSGDKEADRLKAQGKDGEVFRGHVLLKASSKYQPALAAIENKQILDLVTDEAKAQAKKYFYSGAYLVPSFGLHWYKGDEGKPDGVSLYLNAVLFAKHGPRLAGRAQNAAETFKGYIGQMTDENPTAGNTLDEDEFV